MLIIIKFNFLCLEGKFFLNEMSFCLVLVMMGKCLFFFSVGFLNVVFSIVMFSIVLVLCFFVMSVM